MGVELEQCLVTDLKPVVIKLKRILLTTEQEHYLNKIKDCPAKDVSDCMVKDLKPAVIKLKRISLTTEQKEYCSKIKSFSKYSSYFQSEIEIVEEKRKNPYKIQFSKKSKQCEKENEDLKN